MFGIPPIRKMDPDRMGQRYDDYWEAAQKQVLVDPKKLLDNLLSFDKDNIPAKTIAKVEPYMGGFSVGKHECVRQAKGNFGECAKMFVDGALDPRDY